MEIRTTEELEEAIRKHLGKAHTVESLLKVIGKINNTLFAAGAPLGSPLYFQIRGICCKTLYPKTNRRPKMPDAI